MRKQAPIIILLLLFAGSDLTAQTVINAEELRLKGKEKKWAALINTSLGITRNKAGRSINPEIDFRIERRDKGSRIMSLVGYELSRFTNLNIPGTEATNFTNRGFVHLRYNHQLAKSVSWEAFTQAQFDEIQEINIRTLVGVGTRFRVWDKEKRFLIAGTSYMLEYEETSEDPENLIFNRHHRLNTYVSFGYPFNENVAFSTITYFQPRFDVWSDFRVSSVNVFTAQIIKQLSFNLNFEFLYDARPPTTVPNTMYDLSAGFAVRL